MLPVRLCVLYGMPVDWVALDNWQFGGALVATLTACYDLVKSARNDGLHGRRRLLVALAYVALLSPTLGLVGGHIAEISADRYAHLPSMLLGVPLLAACLVQLRPRPRLADAAEDMTRLMSGIGLYGEKVFSVLGLGLARFLLDTASDSQQYTWRRFLNSVVAQRAAADVPCHRCGWPAPRNKKTLV